MGTSATAESYDSAMNFLSKYTNRDPDGYSSTFSDDKGNYIAGAIYPNIHSEEEQKKKPGIIVILKKMTLTVNLLLMISQLRMATLIRVIAPT